MKNGWEKKRLGEVCEFVRGPFGGSLKKNIRSYFKTLRKVIMKQAI